MTPAIAQAEQSPALLAAESMERRFAAALRLWWAVARERVEIGNRWVDTAEFGRLLGRIAEGEGLTVGQPSLLDLARQGFEAGARAAQRALESTPIRKQTVGTDLRLDLLNPDAVNWLRAYGALLIREIGGETEAAIRDVLLRGYTQGIDPRDTGREIRDSIGLTRQQAAAVANYRRMLESGLPAEAREALRRELRDRRYDPSLRGVIEGQRLPQTRIDAMVARYRERLLAYRAEMIARTETLRAANAGQQQAWQQAAAQGLLSETRVRRVWLTARDERLCPDCAPIPFLNAGGVPLTGMFQTPVGPVQYPPLHPSCRCSAALQWIQ